MNVNTLCDSDAYQRVRFGMSEKGSFYLSMQSIQINASRSCEEREVLGLNLDMKKVQIIDLEWGACKVDSLSFQKTWCMLCSQTQKKLEKSKKAASSRNQTIMEQLIGRDLFVVVEYQNSILNIKFFHSSNNLFRNLVEQMVLVILILALVASISGANIYYDNTSITIEVSTSLTVSTINSAFDQCYKLIRRPSALYHLSSESVIQNWTPGTTNNNTVSFPQGPSSHVIDFSVNAAGTFGLTLDSISKSYSTYLLTPNLLFYGTTAISSPTSPTQIKKTASAIYYFYKLYNSTHDAIIKATATNTTYQLTTINAQMHFSPDQNQIAVIQQDSQVFLYFAANLSLKHVFTPTNPVASGTTDTIAFDSTSTLMIIETDNYNPVLIVNCTSYTTAFSFAYPASIRAATFIYSNTNFIAVTGDSSAHLFDTRTSLLHEFTNELPPSSVLATNYNNTVYFCHGNQITTYNFVYGPIIASNSSNSTTNATSNSTNANDTSTNATSNSNNATNNQTNSSSTSGQASQAQAQVDESSFYRPLRLSGFQEQATDNLGYGVEMLMKMLQGVASLLSSSPFVIYFLGFLNYITICSLYVLVNFPIPQQLYKYLKIMFENFNENLFSFTGVHMELDPISPELVNSARPKFFGITSDVLGGNLSDFVIVAANLLLIFGLQLGSMLLRKNSLTRQFFNHNKWDMVFGQIINIIMPSTLPWSFILLQSGARNFSAKLNFLLYYFVLFLSVLFPIYYFFSLLETQKAQIIDKRNAKAKSTTRLPRLITRKIQNLQQKVTFRSLATVQVLGQWFACLSNFMYPLLVLLKDPSYFLIVISLFTVANVLLVSKDFSKNKNYFVLTLYPLTFHTCFLVFYYSSSETILVYTEICCLLCLLVGLIHYSLTAIIKSLHFIGKLLLANCFNKKILPQNQRRAAQAKRDSKDKLLQEKENQIVVVKGKTPAPKKEKIIVRGSNEKMVVRGPDQILIKENDHEMIRHSQKKKLIALKKSKSRSERKKKQNEVQQKVPCAMTTIPAPEVEKHVGKKKVPKEIRVKAERRPIQFQMRIG